MNMWSGDADSRTPSRHATAHGYEEGDCQGGRIESEASGVRTVVTNIHYSHSSAVDGGLLPGRLGDEFR